MFRSVKSLVLSKMQRAPTDIEISVCARNMKNSKLTGHRMTTAL